MNKKNDVKFAGLRKTAEESFTRLQPHDKPADAKDVEVLLQELQVHQIELELQNEELLRASEETELERLKFEGIYNLAPVGYFILDQFGTIEDVNLAGVSLLGAGKGSVRGKRLQSFIKPDETDNFYLFFKELLSSDERHGSQFKFINTHGDEFYGLLEGRFVGSLQTCYVALVDVTEAILARASLAETKDRLQLALEASAAGTWELHIPAMRFYLDEINTRMCGATAFDGTYAGFIQLVHPDDRYEADQYFRKAINSESEIDLVCRFNDANGNLCVANIRGHLVRGETDAEMRFIGIMCNITEKTKLAEIAKDEEVMRQQEITLAALKAEEKERVRISEALHDSVSQLLYGIKIQLSQLSGQDVQSTAAKLHQLLDLAIQETRNISFELAPSILTDFGLASAIVELAERLSSSKMKISAVCSGFSNPRNLVMESMIFRIVQELINNCMKHSGASAVQIQVKKNKYIDIVVKDNGIGFLPASDKPTHGAGLASIRNRISLYKGTMSIDAAAGKGTVIRIKLEDNDQSK
ncbi:PAS domain-containing sensor histidine kinase [Mucilaginibacter sp. HD30]